MNIHPLFVHFPIAFLSLYAVLEIISFGRLGRSRKMASLKAFLSILGTLAAFVTIPTGSLAALSFGDDIPPMVMMHATFAISTTAVFTVIGAGYVLWSLSECGYRLPGWLNAIRRFILNFYVSKLLALAGLTLIFFTGALGGDIVYGPESDPFIKFVHNLLLGQ